MDQFRSGCRSSRSSCWGCENTTGKNAVPDLADVILAAKTIVFAQPRPLLLMIMMVVMVLFLMIMIRTDDVHGGSSLLL